MNFNFKIFFLIQSTLFNVRISEHSLQIERKNVIIRNQNQTYNASFYKGIPSMALNVTNNYKLGQQFDCTSELFYEKLF